MNCYKDIIQQHEANKENWGKRRKERNGKNKSQWIKTNSRDLLQRWLCVSDLTKEAPVGSSSRSVVSFLLSTGCCKTLMEDTGLLYPPPS